eukprot:m.67289 g.67289  ORF g.67289 m.67289 type:complete len:98 (+) comp9858_c0_seq1:1803-2096(+)
MTNDNIDDPSSVEFRVVSRSPIGVVQQNGNGGSTGAEISARCGTVVTECHDRQNTSEILFSTQSITLGTTLVTPVGSSENVECTVSCNGDIQTNSIF